MLIESGVTIGAGVVIGGPVSDPYFNYVTSLIETTSTNGATNNTFIDSSVTNATVTRFGTAMQGSFSPYSDRWSLNCNVGSDNTNYVSTPASANLRLDQGNWTMEFWIYLTAWNTNNRIFDTGANGDGAALVINMFNTGALSWGRPAAGTSVSTGTGVIALNNWYHIALTSEGAGVNGRIYINGTLQGGPTNYTNPTNTAPAFNIGRNNVAAADWDGLQGYMSNFRFVSGQRLYTANFTPQTTPLTSSTYSTNGGATTQNITGTCQLLTLQSNRYVDNSVNAFAITPVGSNLLIQPFSPFAPSATYSTSTIGGSMFLDGSGNYLSIPNGVSNQLGTGDFTIEGWVYLLNYSLINSLWSKGGATTDWFFGTNNTSGRLFFGIGSTDYFAGSGPVVPLNIWNHVAMVRSGTTITTYLNGAIANTQAGMSQNFASTGELRNGRGRDTSSNYLNGYIADARIVKGTAVYTGTFVPPTAPLTAITNTVALMSSTNAGIYDASMKNDLITVNQAAVSTTKSKFSTTSMVFDGTDDRVGSDRATPVMGFGTGNFTIEFWANFDTNDTTDTLFDGRTAAIVTAPIINATAGGNLLYLAGATTLITATAVVSTATWYHIAVSRSSGTTKLFLNGTQVGSSAADTTNYPSFAVSIGANYLNANGFSGYIDTLRITRGIARYTANFTPPTEAFPTS